MIDEGNFNRCNIIISRFIVGKLLQIEEYDRFSQCKALKNTKKRENYFSKYSVVGTQIVRNFVLIMNMARFRNQHVLIVNLGAIKR